MEKKEEKKVIDHNSEIVSVKNIFREDNIQEKNNMFKYRSINVMNSQNESELNNNDNTISALPLNTNPTLLNDNDNINKSPKQNSSSFIKSDNYSNISGNHNPFYDMMSNYSNNNNFSGAGTNNNISNPMINHSNSSNKSILSNQGNNNTNFIDLNNPFIINYLSMLYNPGNNNDNNDNTESFQMNEDCLICFEKLTSEEINNNFIGCSHGFCDDCFYDYFKEKINSKIDEIKCPGKDCTIIIPNYFIEEKIINDTDLLSKYKKLKKMRQLELDPNVEFCPYPNCESYAIKKDNNLVSCIHNGHKFCFNCHNYWHDKGICTIDIYSYYKKWKTSKKIKRCPRCRYLIEKNEGCNHMTCTNCKYEWCWICKGEYTPDHYDFGSKCFGLQYTSNRFSVRFCYTLKQIGMLFLILLIIILLIFIGPPIMFASLQLKYAFLKIYHEENKKVRAFYVFSAFSQYIIFAIHFYFVCVCTLILMIIPSLRINISYFVQDLIDEFHI